MKERVKFLLEWERRWDKGEGRMNFAALCREFGVSRQVGYVWLERYRDAKVAEERSRRPHSSPTKVAAELEDALVGFRKQHPTWGPKETSVAPSFVVGRAEVGAEGFEAPLLRRALAPKLWGA